MPSYTLLVVAGLLVWHAVNSYRSLRKNIVIAKQSGIPYIIIPIYHFNRFWLLTHRLWLPFIELLPHAWTYPWIEYLTPDHAWNKLYDSYKEIGSDAFVSPLLLLNLIESLRSSKPLC